MSAIKGFIHKNKNILTLILIIVISISLMITSDNGIILKLKKDGFTMLTPFLFVTNSVGSFFQDTLHVFVFHHKAKPAGRVRF